MAMILVIVVFWSTSTAYVMNWHHKHGDLSIGTTLLAIFLGPMLAFIVRDNEKEIERQRKYDWNQRWDGIRSSFHGNNFTIPPPPPKKKTKEFKFLSDDKD